MSPHKQTVINVHKMLQKCKYATPSLHRPKINLFVSEIPNSLKSQLRKKEKKKKTFQKRNSKKDLSAETRWNMFNCPIFH